MVNFWEVLDRATNTGERMEEKEFDMKIFKRATELAKEYDIRFDPETPVPTDDSMIKDIFRAGFALYLETGTYCRDSRRVIKCDESEIKESLREASGELTIGAGAEARRLIKREIEDQKPPTIISGVCEGNPSEGDLYLKLYISIAQEKLLDGIYFGPPHIIEGREVRINSPFEVHASKCGVRWVREALRRVGRPGLHLLSASRRAIGDAAVCDPEDGLRRSDAINIPTLPELKTDYEILNRIATSIEYGCLRCTYVSPIIGGYAGGPDTTAIVAAAGLSHMTAVHQGGFSSYAQVAGHLWANPGSSTREAMWLRGVSMQVASRNTNLLAGTLAQTVAGPGTEQMFWEIAAATIAEIVSGGHLISGVRKARLVKPDQGTGLEPRFQAEVAYAAVGMKRENANDFVKVIRKKYEPTLAPDKAPLGNSFWELYDPKTATPRREYLEIYDKVLRELEDMGLKLKKYRPTNV
jgi:methylamine--corrinoid protein Co-methyltransferase